MTFLALVWLLSVDSGVTLDGGTKKPSDVKTSDLKTIKFKSDDQEVIDNLELLEHLDESADLELLQELSVER